jgi:hypothetical protein
VSTLLGTSIGMDPYLRQNGVIGEISRSPAGNTILRVGVADSERWEQVAHVVLTPAERDELIAELTAQRDCSAD